MKRFTKIFGLLAVLCLGIATTFKSDNDKYFEISKNLEIFTNLYKEINSLYVDEVDPGKLMRIGIDAMMESLDPYTNYISESEIEGYRYITEGRYNGIGAISKKIGDYVTITQLYREQPADKAGLKAGDRIVAIDGNDAIGKSIDDINNILRGFPGSEVVLTISRPGLNKEFDVTLTRDEVKVPNVPYKGMISDNIGYVALTTFTRNAGKNVADAVKELKEEQPDLKGVVFDLRGNGGGLLNEAVNVSNVFIPKGKVVVTTRGKVKDWDRSFKTMNQSIDEDIPVVVLIDGNSASASEIVCGVIQDYDRGILIGSRSYGKGLVQNTRDIGYNSKVKLTTAKYYIPSGRCIQSVKYKAGEPVHIPDNQRTPFETKNGRVVLDGGGVKPDIIVDKAEDAAVVRALINKNYIFDFVTTYCLNRDSISSVEDFQFTAFDEFLAYLEEKGFDYETDIEKLLRKLQVEASEDTYNISSEVSVIEEKIEKAKDKDLQMHKEAIVDLIEKEIAGRYYYQIGKIKMGLKNDKEVKEAIAVINEIPKYESILKGDN